MDKLNKKFDKFFPDREEGSIFAVSLDTPALQCVQELKEHNVVCFPVMNRTHEDRLEGLIDLVDICAFVVKLWDTHQEVNSIKFEKLFWESLRWKTAGDVMNYSKMNDCHFLTEKATFKDVLRTLSLPGVHRVPIMGRGGLFDVHAKRPLKRFLTQSDLIRFAALHLSDFGSTLDRPVYTAVGTYPAVCVSRECRTIDAWREMLLRKISSLGVKGDDGKLIGEITVHDIGYVVTAKPGVELTSPVERFLQDITTSGDRGRAVTRKKSDSVRKVISSMYKYHVHCVYIIDGDDEVLGVVSLSDICRFLMDCLFKKSKHTLPLTVGKEQTYAKDVVGEIPKSSVVKHEQK